MKETNKKKMQPLEKMDQQRKKFIKDIAENLIENCRDIRYSIGELDNAQEKRINNILTDFDIEEEKKQWDYLEMRLKEILIVWEDLKGGKNGC